MTTDRTPDEYLEPDMQAGAPLGPVEGSEDVYGPGARWIDGERPAHERAVEQGLVDDEDPDA